MATRAYWTGQIRLSLVSIPVEIVPATRTAARVTFHQVHKPTGSRIRYQKVVPGVGPVESDEIVKGYELDNGKYVLLEDEDFDKVKLEAKKTIELVQFVDPDEIDPLFYDRPFFVLPQDEDDSDAVEAYVVLREALKRTGKVALGQIVIRGQGSIVAIKACGDGLMMETLRYADEVKKPSTAFKQVPNVKPASDLIELAEQLIKRKSKKFDPAAFKDSYQDALRELIDSKVHHREVRQIEEPQRGATVINLMDALRRSVRRGGDEEAKPERPARASKSRQGRRERRAKTGTRSRRKAA